MKSSNQPRGRTYPQRVSTGRLPDVIADVQERQSGIPLALENLGVEVSVAPLRSGDYAVGTNVLVERKSVLDLHGSIERGRFWTQMHLIQPDRSFSSGPETSLCVPDS